MKKGSVIGKIFFVIILISVIENFFVVGGTLTPYKEVSPILWIFVFFAGVNGISYIIRNLDRTKNARNSSHVDHWKKEEPKVEKNEYDFDDEFKIDPKDYE